MNWWYHARMWGVPDYLTIIILAIAAAVIGAKVRPHCRPFHWGDPTIGYPKKPDTFPMYSVAVAVVFVAVVYVVGELTTRWRRSLHPSYVVRHKVGWIRSLLLHLNGWILAHAYSILLAFAIVNISKLYAGRLRPDFIARLAEEGFLNDGSFDPMVAAGPVCDAAREGRLSFPSGHCGTIFSGYVPPVLYLMGLTRQLKVSSYAILTLCMLPLIFPITVAVSRTIDYRHNFDDALTGSVIGAACGVFAVLTMFRVSDTGEWTLRAYPVESRDCCDTTPDGEQSDAESLRERDGADTTAGESINDGGGRSSEGRSADGTRAAAHGSSGRRQHSTGAGRGGGPQEQHPGAPQAPPAEWSSPLSPPSSRTVSNEKAEVEVEVCRPAKAGPGSGNRSAWQ